MSFVVVPKPQRKQSPIWPILAALVAGVSLYLLILSLVTGGFQLLFAGRIFPGITMAGVDLSSMTPQQATQVLQERLIYPSNGQIILRYGDKVWVVKPVELGLTFDTTASVEKAYRLGRQGGPIFSLAGQLNAWQGGVILSPVVILDEHIAYAYLQNIATQIDQPVREADLYLSGTEVVYIPGQVGRLLNVDKTLAVILAQLNSFRDGEVPLVVEEEAPLVQDASVQAQGLRAALSAPLTLSIENPQAGDPPPYTLEPAAIAGMLSVGRVQLDSVWQFQVSVDAAAFDQFLEQIAPNLDRAPENARFYFDDPTGQLVLIQPAVTGRNLDIAATRTAIVQGLLQGQHAIPLALTLAQPAVPDNTTSESLGINGLVSSYTSYFRGSGGPRLQNIKAASAQFHGLLIPPNTTFSMGQAIGDISLDNGYAEALIIYNGQTITGVGGGVCQVSTTLFRAAWYGGYPIIERHEHAYRVYYYEQTANGIDPNLAGMDATVYFPLVDLKFTNDRNSWLLMETYFDPVNYALTWKFYSGQDGRTVEVENLGLRNVILAPEPLFQEDPDLGPNQMKQVDWPGDGTDITITRVVNRDGQILFTDSLPTHYQPWQAVCNFGPGTENPEELADELGLCQ